MSDPADKASQSTTTDPKVVPAGSGDGPKYLTVDEAQKLIARLDGQSKVIASLEKQIKTPEPETQKPVDESLSKRVKELEAENKRVVERETRQREREAVSHIADALINKGADPEFARRQAKLVYSENKDKIATMDDDATPAVKDGDKVIAVSEWMEAYLQTNEGRPLLPPKRNPTSNGLNGRSEPVANNVRRVTSADIAAGRVSTKDLREGKVHVVDAPF